MSVNIYDKENNKLNLVAGGTLYADSPIGSIVPYGGTTTPSGWLLCQGQAVSRTTYADLFAVIGTAFGSGDDSTTFNVPDLREATTKGAGLSGKSSNHMDSDGLAVGEFLDDRLEDHVHTLDFAAGGSTQVNGIVNNSNGRANIVSTKGINTDYASMPSRSGPTTEVKSVGVNYIIKAKHTPIPADFIDAVNDIIKDNARECHGFLINSLLGEIAGFGRAIVTLKDGIAKIEFSAKIESNDMTDGFNWGLNADLLHNLMPDLPNITPISTNSQLQYFAATGDVLIDLMGYSALAIPTGQFWTPARMYLPSGSVGSWGSINFPVNSYITGTVYGTYTV